MKTRTLLICLFLTTAAACPTQGDVVFTPLGGFADRTIFVTDVSNNGIVVANSLEQEAMIWKSTAGWNNLGVGANSRVQAITGDGRFAVGRANVNGTVQAYRWSATEIQTLGSFDDGSRPSQAWDVSSNGTTIVGAGVSNNAFWWSESSGLNNSPQLSTGALTGVSGNGRYAAGAERNGAFIDAFRYDLFTGDRQYLGRLDPQTGSSNVSGVSDNGEAIVGIATVNNTAQAYRWTASGGIESLGALPGTTLVDSQSRDISGSGDIVVGIARDIATPTGSSAFIWDEDNGMQSLKSVIQAEGVDLLGWQLHSAIAISQDGSSIVGQGIDPNGVHTTWKVNFNAVPEPSSVFFLFGLGALVFTKRRRSTVN